MNFSLKQISLQGFRSFEDQTTIALPENGLVLFQGLSGSGKSSVLMAIAYALGYSPYPATELKSWYDTVPLNVSVTLTGTKQGQAIITRGSSTNLVTEQDTIKGAAALNEALPKLLGMDTELLSALTYRPQKTPGLFLSKSNGEMQDFLTTLLGLHKYENGIEASQLLVKDLIAALPVAKEAYEKAEAEQIAVRAWECPPIEDEAILRDLVTEATKFVTEQAAILSNLIQEQAAFKTAWNLEIKKLQKEGKVAVEELGGVQVIVTNSEIERLETAKNQCSLRLNAAIINDKERNAVIQRAIDDAKDNIREYQTLCDKEGELAASSTLIKKRISTLKKSTCPTCQQEWLQFEVELGRATVDLEEVQQELLRIPEYHTDVARWNMVLEDRQKELNTINPLVEGLREALTNIRADIATAKAELQASNDAATQTYQIKVLEIQNAISAKIIGLNAERSVHYDAQERILELTRKDLEAAQQGQHTAETRLVTCQLRNQQARKELIDHGQKLAEAGTAFTRAKAKYEELKADLSIEQDFLELLKTFLTAIFDEVLAEISWNTNEMLRHVPNVAHVTVGFKSESTTAKGTIKRAISPYVVIGGIERNIRTALSGGMGTAVELAVDLAVRKVISARTGVSPGFLILDECFEGLGIAEKEACMSLLQMVGQDTLILVVDHMSEFKELFATRFTVTAENGRSRIELEDGTT